MSNREWPDHDLFPDGVDPGLAKVAMGLELVSRLHPSRRASEAMERSISEEIARRGAAASRSHVSSRATTPLFPTRPWRRAHVLVVAALGILVVTGVAFAASGIANLGKPTNTGSTNQYFPLSGFRKVKGAALTVQLRPEILFIGTQWDNTSAASRWPVVKALNQFGQWSGLKPSSSNLPLPSGVPPAGPYATFDWTHATYRSRFISFVHKDLGDRDGHKLQVLSSHENALYQRLAKAGPTLVIIGSYVFNGSVIPYGDLEDTASAPFSFASVQGALQRGEGGRFSSLVQDVNGSSNVMTALICHADGEKPQSVCTRAIIRDILKYVR